MAYTVPSQVTIARTAFLTARRDLVDKLYAFDAAQAELNEAARELSGTELAEFQQKFDDASSARDAARTEESTRFDALQSAIADWLPDGTSAEDDLSRLLNADPIVLFPVRLEARFDGSLLRLRMFPDEIFLNTHETALTKEEYETAKSYYTKLNEKNANEQVLWRDLVKRFGAPRAAYLLRQMLPVFGDARPFTDWWSSSSTCGGTVTGGLEKALSFPDDIDPKSIQYRSASWTRPGEAVLPDRWVVITQSKTRKLTTLGKRIPEPLALTPDPNVPLSDMVEIPGTGLTIDKRVLWTVDYQSALDVGMAVDIPMVGDEPTQGFDRIMVIGVKTSMDQVETSIYLEKLIDGHHYTRGMALVRQGSPTNNMEGRPTDYPPQENAGEKSFVVERQPAPVDREHSHDCLPTDTDGWALATMLGVPSGVFSNVDRSRQHEIALAKQMNTLLWPATIGYFLRNMMSPVFTWQQVKDAREYFQNFVIARGPAPAFRIGPTPYGVLPIFSMADWQTHGYGDTQYETVENALLKPLGKLFNLWTNATGQVPVIREDTTNPDVDVASVLSTTPSSKQFWFRKGLGPDVYGMLRWLDGLDLHQDIQWMDSRAKDVFASIGYSQWKPRIGEYRFFKEASIYTGEVVASRVREGQPLNPNFLVTFTGSYATPTAVLDYITPTRPARSNLFFDMVRHSLLFDYLYGYLDAHGLMGTWVEREFFGISSWEDEPALAVRTMLTLADAEYLNYSSPIRNALTALSGESTAELERLFTETLDLTSHRLDAWITAIGYRRLSILRRTQRSRYQLQRGDILGGYGWLQDLRPRAITIDPNLGGGIVAEKRATNGGFVHTPSLTHAGAAAVLRNAHLSYRQNDPTTYAIDLSSKRVRDARWLFDGVRSGQPLGALLGYQFERALHEDHKTVPGIDQLRFALRNRFPLVADQSGNDPGLSAETIAARNVVDGCAMLRAYQAGQLTGSGVPTPSSNPDQYNAMKAELDKLAELYDATADLLTAESVFQLVSGNLDAAVPTINNVAKGKQPPQSIFTRSARGGVGISHRVALVFPNDHLPTLPITPGSEPYFDWPMPSPRAQAEAVLNAWLGELIGLPGNVVCTLTYWDKDGTTQIPSTHTGSGGTTVTWTIEVTLRDLRMNPMDLLALTEAVALEKQASMLDRRIVAAAYADAEKKPDKTPTSIRIDYTGVSGKRSFPEILEVLNTAGAMLAASHPLSVADLLAPSEVETGSNEPGSEPVGGANAISFYNRSLDIRTAFEDAITALGTPTTYRDALVAAAAYLPFSAYPDPTVEDAALKEQFEATVKELNRRKGLLPDVRTPLERGVTPSVTLIADATQTLKTIFGGSFVALPEVDPPHFAEIDQSLQARDTLLGSNNDDAPDKYLQQITHSRERLGRWRKLNLYARASGIARPRVDIVQLPYVPGETWLGWQFTTPPTDGRAALLLLNYADALDATEAWRGLVLDDWSEMIPHATEQTGIAFHYEGPQSQAPQAILVAAPSKANTSLWTFGELANSVEQTMRLMKVRAVDLEHLNLGQTLPMTTLASATTPALAISTAISAVARSVFKLGLNDD